MHETKAAFDGSTVRQEFNSDGHLENAGAGSPSVSAALRLLTARDLQTLLQIRARRFYELRADGTIPEPLQVGPRGLRWTHDDYLEVLRRLRRKPQEAEPVHLAEGRRRHQAAARAEA